jgi:hypothetical protein
VASPNVHESTTYPQPLPAGSTGRDHEAEEAERAECRFRAPSSATSSSPTVVLSSVCGAGAPKDRRTPAGQALIDAIQTHLDSHAAMDASIISGDSCARVPPPGEFTKSRLLDGQTPWGPCYFGAANRTSPSDSSRRERCVLVFGVITTASCRMGTLVRPREACAGVEYVGAARVSRRFTRLGRSTTGRHRPEVCARTPTASQFPECVAPPAVSFVTVDSPASRKRPVATCKRSPRVTCLHPPDKPTVTVFLLSG